MPPVPAVRGSQVVGALEKAGFIVGRINGSHHIMRHPDGRRTTVPGRPAAWPPRSPGGRARQLPDHLLRFRQPVRGGENFATEHTAARICIRSLAEILGSFRRRRPGLLAWPASRDATKP